MNIDDIGPATSATSAAAAASRFAHRLPPPSTSTLFDTMAATGSMSVNVVNVDVVLSASESDSDSDGDSLRTAGAHGAIGINIDGGHSSSSESSGEESRSVAGAAIGPNVDDDDGDDDENEEEVDDNGEDNDDDDDEEGDEEGDDGGGGDQHNRPSHSAAIVLEPARLLGHTLQLPQELCDDPLVFAEFFSLDTWNGLSATAQAHLQQFLPQFGLPDAEQNADEQARTVMGLLGGLDDGDGIMARFDVTPMRAFQANLEAGNYRPDIARVRAQIRRQQRREQRFQAGERVSRMAKELLVRSERMLRVAYDAPRGVAAARPTAERSFGRAGGGGGGGAATNEQRLSETAAQRRSNKRYYAEIAGILAQTGLVEEEGYGSAEDDGLFPAGVLPEVMTRKTRKYLSGIQVGCVRWWQEMRTSPSY